jgi:hypothetical protein
MNLRIKIPRDVPEMLNERDGGVNHGKLVKHLKRQLYDVHNMLKK